VIANKLQITRKSYKESIVIARRISFNTAGLG